MPAPASYARRQFPGNATDTTISAGINNSATSCALVSTTGWPTGAYTGGVLCELYSTTTGATAEKVWATDLTGSTLTIVRAADGTSATSHSAGTGIRPIAGAIDADEANRAVNETIGQISAAGQILVGDGTASMAAVAAGTSGRILVGNGTTLASVAVSGDATLSSAGALTIANDAITAAKIAANAVDSSEIAANAVGSSELADNAVDTAAIADNAVTAAKIATAVAGNGLAGGGGTALSVGVDDSTIEINTDALRLKDGGVTSAKIADATIATGDVADDAVTLAKLAASAKPRWAVTWAWSGLLSAGAQNVRRVGGDVLHYPVPEGCAVVGLSVSADDARVAGTLTVTVFKNGSTTGFSAALDGTNTTRVTATQAETADAVAADDYLGVQVNNASFSPATNDIIIDVLLQAV